jgi:hypothetical protein
MPECETKGAGYIDLTLGTTVDGQTITWPASIQCDFWALVCTYPDNKQPLPCTPKIGTTQTTDATFRTLFRGTRSMCGFFPGLTAAGAMQTVDYSRVEVRVNGVQVTESEVALNLLAISLGYDPSLQKGFGWTLSQTALTGRAAARYTRWGMPLIAWRGSNLLAPCDPMRLTEIKVISAVTTTHNWLDICQTPITDDVRTSALKWAGSQGAGTSVKQATDNGNQSPVYTGKGELIPNVISEPYASMKAKQ